MTKAKLTRIPKRVLACVLAVLMVLSCLTMLPFTGFAASLAHAQLESPAVVQDGSKYYAFGSGNVLYSSDDMADWDKADPYISVEGVQDIVTTYEGRLDETITEADLSSPEVVEINGIWYLYISAMSGSTSMILRAASASGSAVGPYTSFDPIMETGFERRAADDVLQGYIQDAYGDSAIPDLVSEWGKGTCYYYSNFLGLNYQWYTEELPRAYAPSIAQDDEGNYWMAYGYRDGGIWMQKIDPETGLVDYTWSGNNYAALGGWQTSPYQYMPEEDYNTSSVGEARLDPYFGELLVHTTEGGDTDTLLSSVSRAGEEPELYFADGTAYLQVTYGGPNNSDGYNVRSYKNDGAYHPNGTTDTWNFVDMKGESGVNNADAGMITDESDRTGLKLMGDYNMPGTASATYYTSPGASSVSTGENGLTFYNYQVKFNNATNGNPASDTGTEMRSHILLHNVNGDPLVTPFEYTGDTDKDLYDAAATEYDVNDQIVGQYYVVSSGGETSTSKESVGGVTLTAGGLVMGMISGTWEFETIGNYQNGVVIHDQVNDVDYHGAFLIQTVEDSTSIDSGNETAMTFTLVGNNQTVWGVWYDNYTPGGENNADANLSISPAIYTGGALDLNARQIGQLGLKWGNYITALKFADIDYSTYLTIDSNFVITEVRDEDDNDGVNGIGVAEVTLNSIDSIVNTMYVDRALDAEEAGKSGADNGDFNGDANGESASLLRQALTDKLAEVPAGQKLYILTGYLDSEFYGREAYTVNDKGDISLRVSYTDTETDTEFSERVYSHVYQQPVPANLSAAVYYDTFGSNNAGVNATFIRAEGSYATDSVFPGGNTVRNSNMRNSATKYFAAVPTFGYYNNTLYTDHPNFGADGATQEFFHNNLLPIVDWDDLGFNEPYRTTYTGTDIVVSYEQTFNDDGDSNYDYSLAAGPRAMYYIDLSSADTSNIAGYYDVETQQYTIPLYYSSLYNVSDFDDDRKTFNYYTDANSTTYSAGLYPDYEYTMADNDDDRTGPRNGAVYNPDNSNYVFKANFDDVEYMYDGNNSDHNDGGTELVSGGLPWSDWSYSANIWITADKNSLVNNTVQNYNASNVDDYNFYVRTRSETVSGLQTDIWGNRDSHLRLIQDMEYGIYISDKTFLRDYYNQVMEDKMAQNYTYYSWEQFREATRLINDYLNNYMQLADSYTNYGAAGYSDEDFAGDDAEFQQWFTSHNTTAAEVMTSESLLNSMLTDFNYKVQNVLCYLLTEAENQLFEYSTFQDFKNAYSEYTMLAEQMGKYTASSWHEYMDLGDLVIEGTDIKISDLDAYLVTSNDSDTDLNEIYDPSQPDGTYTNYSWKIIYDGYLDGDAKAVFEAATEAIRAAVNVLRTKADYTNLNTAMDSTTPYTTDRDSMDGAVSAGNEQAAGITGTTGSDIFSIDRSTVATLAESMSQGYTHYSNDSGSYTVSSVAALDKILAQVFDVEGSGHEPGTYEDGVATEDATNTLAPIDPEGIQDTYYSDLVRDDQQRFADAADGNGEDKSTYSKVQTDIEYQARLVNAVLNQMQTLADPSEYETFDYLIDVISTIDFNAYTPEGQELLWNKLSELLVEGGVYSVNQQIFAEDADESTSELEQALFDGDNHYYTGLNAGDVDTATTELMTLLTELDETQRRLVTLTVELYMTDTDDSSSVSGEEPYMTDIYPDLRYGDSEEVSVAGILQDYDPANYFAYSWVITTDGDDGTTPTTNYLGGLESYDFIATANTTLKIYVAKMSNPYYGVEPVRVTVRNQFGGQSNEFVMSLAPDLLSEYSVSVSEDDGSVLTIYHNGEPIGRQIAAGRVPFYDFEHWTVNGRVMQPGQSLNLGEINSDAITILSTYAAEDSNFTVSVINAAGEGQITSGYTFDSLVTITATTPSEGQTFYAWLVDDGYNDSDIPSELNDPYNWKIASYNETYTYLATASERFIQVNKDTETGMYYLQTGQMISAQPANGVLDATSLYYRLEHQLADSWSNITREYDSESGKVSLFSHFTDMGDSVARVTEHGVVAITNPSKAGDIVNDRDLFVIGATGVNKGVSHSDSSSGQSSGQYVVSIAIPESALDGRTIYMRSYATTEYELDADDLAQNQNDGTSLGSSDVFVINYSEIASVELPKMVSATEDGSMEEE